MILGSVAELIAGIIGVKKCKKPEKATSCLVFGIIVAIIMPATIHKAFCKQFISLSSITAVSYTHLDVYKRQIQHHLKLQSEFESYRLH